MRVTRVARLAAATAVSMMMVAGCANMRHPQPKALIARPGVLTHGETLQYLGVDFSRAAFFDVHFQYADVAKTKVQSWSQYALSEAQFPMPVNADLAITDKANSKIPESAFKVTAPEPGKWPLNDSVVRGEIAPYIGKKNSGHALLIVAEQVSKPVGVNAHYVVFDRKSGEIVLLDQMTAEAGGFGIYEYYLSALKAVAAKAQKEISAITQ